MSRAGPTPSPSVPMSTMVYPGERPDESAQAATATTAGVDSATRVIRTFLPRECALPTARRRHQIDGTSWTTCPGRPLDRPKRRGHAASCTPSDLRLEASGSGSGPCPDDCVNLAAGDVTATRDLTTVVQGVGNAVLPTGQRAEIAHAVSRGPEERACVPISVPAAPSDLSRAIDGYADRAAAAERAEVQHSHGLTPEEGVLFLCGRDAVTRHVTALIDIVPDGAISRPGAAEVADVAKAIFLAPDERGAEEIADIAPTRDLFKVIDAQGLGIHPTKGAEVPHRARPRPEDGVKISIHWAARADDVPAGVDCVSVGGCSPEATEVVHPLRAGPPEGPPLAGCVSAPTHHDAVVVDA